MGQEDMRKGPWTEQEDLLLINIVGLFGDRRWDFVAKVSGLNRTGKSCRLRWVNYLHPGLKRGKMTPQEEKLVLELHAKWGNRWSRIARKIPGRTDNEIKNYWRTHMRKKAQETKKVVMSSPTTSSDASSESSNPTVDSSTSSETGQVSFYDTGGHFTAAFLEEKQEEETSEKSYSMDDIWKEIDKAMIPQERCNFSYPPPLASPAWEYWSESLWRMDDEESKMLLPLHKDKQFMDYCEPQGVMFLT